MSCNTLSAVRTLTIDLNDVERHWPVTPFVSIHEVDPTAIEAFLKVLRIVGAGAAVGVSVRATTDQNNPGSFTTVGSTVTSVAELLQTLNVSTTTANNLFVQFAVTGQGTGPGQAEVTVWIQG